MMDGFGEGSSERFERLDPAAMIILAKLHADGGHCDIGDLVNWMHGSEEQIRTRLKEMTVDDWVRVHGDTVELTGSATKTAEDFYEQFSRFEGVPDN